MDDEENKKKRNVFQPEPAFWMGLVTTSLSLLQCQYSTDENPDQWFNLK
jgi:hypothetical protein